MCGINGIFAYHYAANPIDRGELLRTRDHMAPRGPDGAGEWVSADERVAFGHRRLAIIDLSETGAQPMLSADGLLAVTFNGEIYNYRELRAGLESRGVVFRSHSDTEVLLHLYAERGSDMVHALRGMFAFALWDARRGEMLMARDPYGIKPLYYADDGWTVRFASQVKALRAGGAVGGDPEPAGLAGFFLFGSVPEPFTTLREVRALPAGCTLKVDRLGAQAPQRYHAIAAAYAAQEQDRDRTAAEVETLAREAVLDSVRHHLVADVPVGAFLSAGVDSGALVGLMRDAGASDIQTITIGFEEFAGRHDDEAPLAAAVAERYGTRHTLKVVRRSEFEADLPRLVDAMDQPSIDGINTWFVSKAAHELGLKVAISGLGGDELLGGYPSFRDIPRWTGLMSVPSRIPGLGRALRAGLGPLAGMLGLNPKAAGLAELGGTDAGAYLLKRGLYLPWELPRLMPAELAREGLRRLQPMALVDAVLAPRPATAFGRVAALESSLYMRNQLLRDTDWASMAHGLEVRVPLVDPVLLSRLAPLQGRFAGRSGKALLAALPSRPLPDAVVNRPKTGFATPIDSWMRTAPAGQQAASLPAQGPWARRWSQVVCDVPVAA